MAYTKTILCLAASRKHRGYCFAGKDILTGEWIRPVSDRQDEEISSQECAVTSGVEANLLDILEIPLIKAISHNYQTENHLIDTSKNWKKVGEGTARQVEDAIDEHSGPLWLNQDASWMYRNNRVLDTDAVTLGSSLLLIQPSSLRIKGGRRGGSYDDADDWLVKSYFTYSGSQYTLAVTDPDIEARFAEGGDVEADMTGVAICVSLGEIHRGYAYKLVAAVIEP